MIEARNQEVLETVGEQKQESWKQKNINPSHVPLTASYDTGWNKKKFWNQV